MEHIRHDFDLAQESDPVVSLRMSTKKICIKVSVQSKRKKKENKPTGPKVGLPTSSHLRNQKRQVMIHRNGSNRESTSAVEHDTRSRALLDDDDEVEEEDFLSMDEIPCDTILLMRNMEQNQTCLFVPIDTNFSTNHHGNCSIPFVLESQLISRFMITSSSSTTTTTTTTAATTKGTAASTHGIHCGDSSLLQELQDLQTSNRIRRLASLSSYEQSIEFPIVAWVETKHYVRAVWMLTKNKASPTNPITPTSCHSHDTNINSKAIQISTWFLSNLKHWTKRLISKDAMKKSWKQSAHGALTLDQAIDWLLHEQLLMPLSCSDNYVLWLPLWGSVLAAMEKAQSKFLAQLRRSLYKELSIKSLEGQSYPGGLAGSLVMHLLQIQGKVQVLERPAGKFVKLLQS